MAQEPKPPRRVVTRFGGKTFSGHQGASGKVHWGRGSKAKASEQAPEPETGTPNLDVMLERKE